MVNSPVLHVNLQAITANWQLLAKQFSGRETGAVVKANGYGLGAMQVASALERAGCHTFFVATLDEALELRTALPDVRIVVFHGVQMGEEFAFINHRIIPALASMAQIERWQLAAREHVHAASLVHIDTAMARLGLQPDEFFALMESAPDILKHLRCAGLMSHLACSHAPEHESNAMQLGILQKIRALHPTMPISLCNSGGVFLPHAFHFDLARPGCALYGIRPQDDVPNPMAHTASWRAPILQIRTLTHAQAVGYGATQTLPAGAKIATVASGYADGYLRCLTAKAVGYIDEHCVPLAGRVTMDMLSFDVSALPDNVLEGAEHIELLGDKDGIRVDDLAEKAGTIGYEILTRIGTRVRRVYT